MKGRKIHKEGNKMGFNEENKKKENSKRTKEKGRN